jgi:3-carboxy-cis,cis-muconate cycloisomerase
MLSEALTFALSPILGRNEAKRLVQAAGQLVLDQQRHLVDIIREQVSAPLDWDALKDEATYLGSSNTFIDRVLHEAEKP